MFYNRAKVLLEKLVSVSRDAGRSAAPEVVQVAAPLSCWLYILRQVEVMYGREGTL